MGGDRLRTLVGQALGVRRGPVGAVDLDVHCPEGMEGLMPELEPIALVDLDGTTADFDGEVRRKLVEMANPDEDTSPEALERLRKEPWMKARRQLIKAQRGFWRNLQPLRAGLYVVRLMRQLRFRIVVLTKGPHRLTEAWTEKVQWAQEHIPDAGVCIVDAEDSGKGLVYGKVLFDDWPAYIESWLEWRPRGLVIMTDQPWNQDFKHLNVLRFHPAGGPRGHMEELRARLEEARDR
jgi:FMN phosphatase YigB (HAD superfamily)